MSLIDGIARLNLTPEQQRIAQLENDNFILKTTTIELINYIIYQKFGLITDEDFNTMYKADFEKIKNAQMKNPKILLTQNPELKDVDVDVIFYYSLSARLAMLMPKMVQGIT